MTFKDFKRAACRWSLPHFDRPFFIFLALNRRAGSGILRSAARLRLKFGPHNSFGEGINLGVWS